MKRAIGEADCGNGAHDGDLCPGDAVWERGEPEANGDRGEAEDPERLSEEEAGAHAREDQHGVARIRCSLERHARVREGKQRHDSERDPAVKRVLEALER